MSEQTTGQGDFPPSWGFPSSVYNYCTGQYETGGMIWYGEERCTLDDVLALMEDPRNNGSIDRLTLCGTNDPAWTTERDVKLTQPCYKQKITVG
jgi:hypothetical protein